jgi:hypothetical protein
MTFKCFPFLLLVSACSPYQDGEFNAGPIDAPNFPLDGAARLYSSLPGLALHRLQYWRSA